MNRYLVFAALGLVGAGVGVAWAAGGSVSHQAPDPTAAKAFVAHIPAGRAATLVPASAGVGAVRVRCRATTARVTYVLPSRLPTSRVILSADDVVSETLQPGQSLTTEVPLASGDPIVELVVLPFSQGPTSMISGWFAVSTSAGRPTYRCDAASKLENTPVR